MSSFACLSVRRSRPLRRVAAIAVAAVAAGLATGCAPADSLDGGEARTPSGSSQGATTSSVRREPGLDVLLITIDTLRADALGVYGNARSATPLLDRLADGGVRFERARAHNVVTLPSHATILSGRLPHEHGIRDNSGFRFPEGQATLASILGQRGYRTGAFVSAFPLASRFGLDRGFDVYEDGFVDVGTRPALLEQERPGAETVALAARWLAEGERASAGAPSFAWVHLYEPHYPYEPPPPFDQSLAPDPYLGEVAAADAALEPLLGPILAAAEDCDALVVVTSDHGEALGEHGEATHGIFAYESTLRVPLILYQPRLLAPRVVDAPARLIDLLPTVLDLLGEPVPAAVASGLSGRSLAGLAAGMPPESPTTTYFEALSGQLNRGWAPLLGVVHEGWKAIRLPIPELYDLESDRGEERNLAATEPERLRELDSILDRVLETALVADPGVERVGEDEETRKRLESLGYLVADAEAKQSYTEEDDPKRLIGLDAELREITGLYAAGRLEAARSRSRDLVSRRPGMRVALMTLAQIEHDLGDLEAAIPAMRRAFELQPEDAGALASLLSYLTQAGRAREAVALSAAYAARERPDLDVLFMRSLALARSGSPGEAMATIERARRLEPGNPMVAVYEGTHLLMAGARREARAAFERALALDGGTVRALTALAVLDTEDGRIEEALAHWRRAVALDPREHAKLLAIAGRQWSAGRQQHARPLLELFAESAPREQFAAEIERVRALLAAGAPGRAPS